MPSIRLQWQTGYDAASYEIWRGSTASSGDASYLGSTAGNAYTDATVAEGASWYYFVKAVGPGGTSAFGPAAGPFTGGYGLAPPENVQASGSTVDDITVSWEAVAGADVYSVYRHTSDDYSSATLLYSDLSSLEYVDSPPAADTPYFYWIRAFNTSSESSPPSFAAVGFAALPATTAPTGLSASDSDTTKIHVSWTAESSAARYDVYRHTSNDSGAATKIGSTTGTAYDDTTTAYGATRWYWVKAVNYQGASGFSNGDSGVKPAPPPPPPPAAPYTPTGVDATDGDSGKVTVTWDLSGDASHYEVWRSATDDVGTAGPLAFPIYGLTYDDTAIEDEVVYYYWVRAVAVGPGGSTASGFSTPSASGWGDFFPPDPPISVTASDGTQGDDILVSWYASVGAGGYEIWRGTTVFEVDMSHIATAGAVLEYIDPQTDLTSWYYRIKAIGAGGTSALSTANDYGYAAAANPPAPPTVTNYDPAKIGVSWSAVDFARRYWVWRSITNDFATAGHIATDLEVLFYDDVDAEFDTTYYYWIVAHNNAGASTESPSTAGYRPLVAPAAPTGINASDAACAYVTVTWDAALTATSYEVWRADVNNSYFATKIADGLTALTYDDSPGGYPGAVWYYWVKAVNAAGTSGFSASNGGQAYAPGDPTGQDATDYNPTVTVSWTPVTCAESYRVFRGTTINDYESTEIAAGVTGTSFEDTTATAGLQYYYWVKATAGAFDSNYSGRADGMALADACGLSLSGTGAAGHDVTYGLEVGENMVWNLEAGTTYPDRLIVYNNGTPVFDTGCITGSASSGSLYFNAGTLRVLLLAACDASASGTWSVSSTCS